jgi:UDP-glucose 6-dehydrogenase
VAIAIFGSGYVGLVTSTCFAAAGVEVIGVDMDSSKLFRLQQGECPIYEPGLQALMQESIAAPETLFIAVARSIGRHMDARRIVVMDVRSADLTKYAANAMLATKILFMNELANLAERLGASCFPKDVQAAPGRGSREPVPEATPAPSDQPAHRRHARSHRLLAKRVGPSRELLEALWADGATVEAYDPKAAEQADALVIWRWLSSKPIGWRRNRRQAQHQ